MAKRALGKGLEALIPTLSVEEEKERVVLIPVEKIQLSPNQPREKLNIQKLKELISSIQEKGVIQPILVRKVNSGYELISGQRRVEASKKLGYQNIPAIVKEVPEEEALELALIENIQREELNPIDEAKAYKVLLEKFKLTQEEIARRVGKDRTTITNTLRLLNLPEVVQENVSRETISPGHARALLRLTQPHQQILLMNRIIREGLSVRKTENIVKRGLKERAKKQTEETEFISPLEEKLRDFFKTKVKIVQKRGKGELRIEFYSYQELERLLHLIGVTFNSL
jgi:ParB family chromosome partitioning protein